VKGQWGGEQSLGNYKRERKGKRGVGAAIDSKKTTWIRKRTQVNEKLRATNKTKKKEKKKKNKKKKKVCRMGFVRLRQERETVLINAGDMDGRQSQS